MPVFIPRNCSLKTLSRKINNILWLMNNLSQVHCVPFWLAPSGCILGTYKLKKNKKMGGCEQMSMASGRHFAWSKGKETSSCSHWLCCYCCHILPIKSSWENHMPLSQHTTLTKYWKAGQMSVKTGYKTAHIKHNKENTIASVCYYNSQLNVITQKAWGHVFSKLTADKLPPERSRSSRWNKVSCSPRSRRRSSRLMSSVAPSQHREASLLRWQGTQTRAVVTDSRCWDVEVGSLRTAVGVVNRRRSGERSHFDVLLLMGISDLGNYPSTRFKPSD